MNQFTYLVANRIWQLTVINLTALCLTILGGIVFGAAPAGTAALHAVHRLDTLTAFQLLRVMWATYRAEFKRANIIFLPICMIAAVLIWIGPSLGTFGFALALCAAMIAFCYAAGALLITAHIDANIRDTLHNTRMALVLSPYGHLVALLALGPWLWLIWQQPLVGLYGGLSVPAFVYSGMVLPTVTAGFPPPHTPIIQQEALI